MALSVKDYRELLPPKILQVDGFHRVHLAVGHLKAALIVVHFSPVEDHKIFHCLREIFGGASSPTSLVGSSAFFFLLGDLEMKHFKSSHSWSLWRTGKPWFWHGESISFWKWSPPFLVSSLGDRSVVVTSCSLCRGR